MCLFLSCKDNKKEERARVRMEIQNMLDKRDVEHSSSHIERVGKMRLSLTQLGIKGKEADRYIDSIERKILKDDTLATWYIKYKNLHLKKY